MKILSYCNYSTFLPKNKASRVLCKNGFLLLEAMVCVVVLVGMSSAIALAGAYATNYFSRARLLHMAVDIASQTMDQALFAQRPPEKETAGVFTIATQMTAMQIGQRQWRVTVSWNANGKYESIELTSVANTRAQKKENLPLDTTTGTVPPQPSQMLRRADVVANGEVEVSGA